ncbi:MAG: hypothetical protein M3512_01590, partial [Bacteroidota bacterium]|nr:hypothetical protein [Bacteroidota bacterium]
NDESLQMQPYGDYQGKPEQEFQQIIKYFFIFKIFWKDIEIIKIGNHHGKKQVYCRYCKYMPPIKNIPLLEPDYLKYEK